MVRLRDSWRSSLSVFPIPENPLPTPSAGVRIILTFGVRKVVEQGADRLPECILRSCSRLPEQRLELGKKLLDRVEVRRVGREVKHTGPRGPDRLTDTR